MERADAQLDCADATGRNNAGMHEQKPISCKIRMSKTISCTSWPIFRTTTLQLGRSPAATRRSPWRSPQLAHFHDLRLVLAPPRTRFLWRILPPSVSRDDMHQRHLRRRRFAASTLECERRFARLELTPERIVANAEQELPVMLVESCKRDPPAICLLRDEFACAFACIG